MQSITITRPQDELFLTVNGAEVLVACDCLWADIEVTFDRDLDIYDMTLERVYTGDPKRCDRQAVVDEPFLVGAVEANMKDKQQDIEGFAIDALRQAT